MHGTATKRELSMQSMPIRRDRETYWTISLNHALVGAPLRELRSTRQQTEPPPRLVFGARGPGSTKSSSPKPAHKANVKDGKWDHSERKAAQEKASPTTVARAPGATDSLGTPQTFLETESRVTQRCLGVIGHIWLYKRTPDFRGQSGG
jgi:hypothetical protein